MNRENRWGDQWPAGAECLISPPEVAASLDAQAARLLQRIDGCKDLTLMVLMNGGMWPALEIARRLDRPFRLDHVQASRYREALEGAELHWGRWPERIAGTIVLIDDIFDEGYTMDAVEQRLLKDGADEVVTLAMALKQHDRGLPRDRVDDAAFDVPDRYVFGCGMDWKGLWRQLDGVWAIGDSA